MKSEYIQRPLNRGQTASTVSSHTMTNTITGVHKLGSTPRARCDSFYVYYTETLDELLGLNDDLDNISSVQETSKGSTMAPLTPPVVTTAKESTSEMLLSDDAEFDKPKFNEWDFLLNKATKLFRVPKLKSTMPKTLEKKATFEAFVRPSTPVTQSKKRKIGKNSSDDALRNHRLATSKRSRVNGRFKQCEIEWVNVNQFGEMML
jgi:hypothetical protein